jgi:hypothetical protein
MKGGNLMIKKILILLAVMTFTLSLAGTCLSAGTGKEIEGAVTKIEGSRVTILDNMGGEMAIEIKDPATLKNLTVGDWISIKGGMLSKESGKSSTPAPEPGQ